MIEKSIAVIGSTTIDKNIYRNRSVFKAGGVTLYAGTTYSRHAIRTAAITNIADHHLQLISCLEKQRISVFNGQTKHTTHFINDIRTDSLKQVCPKRATPISRRQLRIHLKDVHAVHLGPLHPKDIDIDALLSLTALDLEVILDVQGLVRRIENEQVYPAVSQHLSDALSVAQIVKANKYEYAIMLDFFKTDLSSLMQQYKIREFIVTAGADGGFIQEPAKNAIPYAANAVRFEDDPTGAGDVFLAAYVIPRLFKQQSIPKASQYAAKLAARQVEGNFIKADDLCLKNAAGAT
jgi:sugar/nucleoside kinase (ribokinase family)